MPDMSDYEELSRRRLSAGFVTLEAVTFRHRRFDGEMSAPVTREIVANRDAAAGLIHDRNAGALILVEQFRAPTVAAGQGRLLEIVAGLIDGGETPEQAFRREALEETGYAVEAVRPLAAVFTSPGVFSERVHLFHAETRTALRRGAGGGDADEDIRVVALPVADARRMLENGEIADAKTCIALQAFFMAAPH